MAPRDRGGQAQVALSGLYKKILPLCRLRAHQAMAAVALSQHSDPDEGVLSLPDEAEALAPSSNDVFEGPHQGFHDGSDAFLTC